MGLVTPLELTFIWYLGCQGEVGRDVCEGTGEELSGLACFADGQLSVCEGGKKGGG